MLVNVNDSVDGAIVGPNGEVLNKPTQILTSEEAALLRRYKKFLLARGLKETLHCNTCFEGNLADGMRAFVTDGNMLLECRHRMLWYQGQSF